MKTHKYISHAIKKEISHKSGRYQTQSLKRGLQFGLTSQFLRTSFEGLPGIYYKNSAVTLQS